jgi:hypothetical protein
LQPEQIPENLLNLSIGHAYPIPQIDSSRLGNRSDRGIDKLIRCRLNNRPVTMSAKRLTMQISGNKRAGLKDNIFLLPGVYVITQYEYFILR